MDTPISPLAPASFPKMPSVAGVRFGTANSGARYVGRPDLLFVDMVEGTVAAGVFTQSKTASAPVDWCRKGVAAGTGRGLVVNAGNANAFTGWAGEEAVRRTAEKAADILSCEASEVYVASTGTIGEPLDDGKITTALADLHKAMGEDQWEEAATAIMTTDTYPKGATRTTNIGGVPVTICGIAKGSGMIAPDMATMLSFVFTDAALPQETLQDLLKAGADKSFNSITVDSDTSTSDTLMLFATGQAGNALDGDLGAFQVALQEVLTDLAHHVVRDGEGATKFVAITVTGAEDDVAARRIGLAIANSPLVKTAIAGEDANWGRVVMAVGKAGEMADRDAMRISFGGYLIAEKGQPVPGYDETPVAEHMKTGEVVIEVDVGIANGKSTVWTCDLTHGYIDINADYRT